MIDFYSKPRYDFEDLCQLVRVLRAPDGCPWDSVQTHESIRRNFLEEVYEACEAIDQKDPVHLREELGDVLFSAVNVARFYKLDSEELMHAACAKFIRRFRYMEEKAAERGLELDKLTLAQQEEIYQQGRHDLEGKEPVKFISE